LWKGSGNGYPGSGGEVDKTATPRARRELIAQVAERLSTGGIRMLDWTREVPAKVGPRHGGRFGCSQDAGVSRSHRDTAPPSLQSTRHHVQYGSIREFTFGRPTYLVSLRAQRSNPDVQGGQPSAISNPCSATLQGRAQSCHPWRKMDVSLFFRPTRSPRPDGIGTRDDNSFGSLRGSKPRGNLAPYNNVDHYNPWRTLHREGAGRSWGFSETSNICLR